MGSMNKLSGLHRSSSRPILGLFYISSALLLVAYVILYQYAPLGDVWNNVLLNSITVLAALAVALIATRIFRSYEPDEQPRVIWKYLMTATWFWFVAEFVWSSYYISQGEVPVPSLADGLWVAGFVCFTLAFYHQYSLILPSRKNHFRNVAVASWVLVLLLPYLALTFTNSLNLSSYIDFYYPFADLAVGLAGLILVFTFQGGALMRPWLGLVVFGVSDLLYAWAEKAGIYAWSEKNGSFLTLFIDSSYLAAYLILAMGFLGHWILMKYGLRASREHSQE